LTATVAACALIWLYLPQVRALAQPWRLILPGLRAIALLVLVVAILRPVVVRPRSSGEAGAIVLLIDRSRSMSVRDTGRSPAQLVALAIRAGLAELSVDISQVRAFGTGRAKQ
jgi:hypothetical protein